MHEVHKNPDISVLKEYYCHCCGEMLEVIEIKQIVSKGDYEYKKYCMNGRYYTPYKEILVVDKELFCPKCFKKYSCDDQRKIMEAQKFYDNVIISDIQICDYKEFDVRKKLMEIKKCKPLLLIPLFGGIICILKLINTDLDGYLDSKVGAKLSFASLTFLVVTSLIIKGLFSLFDGIILVNVFFRVVRLIFSLEAFNIPVWFYMNKKTKNIDK